MPIKIRKNALQHIKTVMKTSREKLLYSVFFFVVFQAQSWPGWP
jgi:hypothetical protein